MYSFGDLLGKNESQGLDALAFWQYLAKKCEILARMGNQDYSSTKVGYVAISDSAV